MSKGTKTNRGTTPKQPRYGGFASRPQHLVQIDRRLVRMGVERRFKEESTYKNPQHADRRARAEDGAYDRNAANRVLVVELDGAYMAAPEEDAL